MEEISGPIIAITLVLCAVFVPCAFISGITGRFFRQFAVTIAASTVISAINALTMTPSRAPGDFQDRGEGRNGGHEHKREALPWWIFGLLGGCHRLAVDRRSWPSGRLPPMPTPADEMAVAVLAVDRHTGFYFTPGHAGRPGARLVHHSAGQLGARRALPRLQLRLRSDDRRSTAGRSAAACG